MWSHEMCIIMVHNSFWFNHVYLHLSMYLLISIFHNVFNFHTSSLIFPTPFYQTIKKKYKETKEKHNTSSGRNHASFPSISKDPTSLNHWTSIPNRLQLILLSSRMINQPILLKLDRHHISRTTLLTQPRLWLQWIHLTSCHWVSEKDPCIRFRHNSSSTRST